MSGSVANPMESEAQPRRRSLLGLGDGSVEEKTRQGVESMAVSALDSDESDKEEESSQLPSATAQASDTSISTTTSTISGGDIISSSTVTSAPSTATSTPPLVSPQQLASQIHPALAALRSSQLISALSSSSSLGMTPLSQPSSSGDGSKRKLSMNTISPPLLMPTANCSGYFVEPVCPLPMLSGLLMLNDIR